MNINSPLISIITVIYNGVGNIESTIQSALQQTYKNIEYLVIDGGSTDGSLDIIKKYEDKISYWISEPDNGIYDAMNKGIEVATGKWINFLNCGDVFYDDGVIDKIFSKEYPSEIFIIYGDTFLLKKSGMFLQKANIKTIKRITPFCHQSTFFSTTNKEILKYDTSYKISADYNLIYSFFYGFGLESFYYCKFPISIFEAETGISSKKTNLMKEEHLKIRSAHKDLLWFWDTFKMLLKKTYTSLRNNG